MSSSLNYAPTIYRYKGGVVEIVKRIRCGCGCPNCTKPIVQVKVEEIGGRWDDYCTMQELERIDG